MKAITALAAAALMLGVTTASVQAASSSESKSGAIKAHRAKMHHSGVTGRTPGTNPNPTWNRNPDPEVPGNTEQ